MNTDRDRVIAEALGLCYYEFPDESSAILYAHDPDFSTPDGMALILKLGPKREWWEKIRMWSEYMDWGNEKGIKVDFISINLLQDPNRIADELRKFLKENKICG